MCTANGWNHRNQHHRPNHLLSTPLVIYTSCYPRRLSLASHIIHIAHFPHRLRPTLPMTNHHLHRLQFTHLSSAAQAAHDVLLALSTTHATEHLHRLLLDLSVTYYLHCLLFQSTLSGLHVGYHLSDVRRLLSPPLQARVPDSLPPWHA